MKLVLKERADNFDSKGLFEGQGMHIEMSQSFKVGVQSK